MDSNGIDTERMYLVVSPSGRQYLTEREPALILATLPGWRVAIMGVELELDAE